VLRRSQHLAPDRIRTLLNSFYTPKQITLILLDSSLDKGYLCRPIDVSAIVPKGLPFNPLMGC